MKKMFYLILSIILVVLGMINCSLVLLFGLFGSFMCGKPFYMISSSKDSIPNCVSIFSTDFVSDYIIRYSFIINWYYSYDI